MLLDRVSTASGYYVHRASFPSRIWISHSSTSFILSSIHPSIGRSVPAGIRPSTHIHPPIHPSGDVSCSAPIQPSIHLSIHIHLFIDPSIHWSKCPVKDPFIYIYTSIYSLIRLSFQRPTRRAARQPARGTQADKRAPVNVFRSSDLF